MFRRALWRRRGQNFFVKGGAVPRHARNLHWSIFLPGIDEGAQTWPTGSALAQAAAGQSAIRIRWMTPQHSTRAAKKKHAQHIEKGVSRGFRLALRKARRTLHIGAWRARSTAVARTSVGAAEARHEGCRSCGDWDGATGSSCWSFRTPNLRCG